MKVFRWIYNNIIERGQYCTAWFDGWFGRQWGCSCCKDHDWYYMNQDKHNMTKQEVDKALFMCVKERGGVLMACTMWLGNKAFSWYYWDKYNGK